VSPALLPAKVSAVSWVSPQNVSPLPPDDLGVPTNVWVVLNPTLGKKKIPIRNFFGVIEENEKCLNTLLFPYLAAQTPRPAPLGRPLVPLLPLFPENASLPGPPYPPEPPTPFVFFAARFRFCCFASKPTPTLSNATLSLSPFPPPLACLPPLARRRPQRPLLFLARGPPFFCKFFPRGGGRHSPKTTFD